MYFDFQEVNENLICSYCNHKFTGLVKLVPQCGSSICEECYEALLSDLLEESREFKCKSCNYDSHTMPKEGLPDEKLVMKLIKMQPIVKPLNEKTKTLKSTIEDIQQRIDMLKSYDKVGEINAYCDLLENEVILTVESSIKHLRNLQVELLSKINAYRKELVNLTASDSQAAPIDPVQTKDLENLSNDFEAFKKSWYQYFDQIKDSWNDEKIEQAQKSADKFKQIATGLERRTRDRTFNNNFLSFKENFNFYTTLDHLGKLENLFKAEEKSNVLNVDIVGAETKSFFALASSKPQFAPPFSSKPPISFDATKTFPAQSTTSLFGAAKESPLQTTTDSYDPFKAYLSQPPRVPSVLTKESSAKPSTISFDAAKAFPTQFAKISSGAVKEPSTQPSAVSFGSSKAPASTLVHSIATKK